MKTLLNNLRACSALLAACLCWCGGIIAAAETTPRVDVILWFDTEDYLSPGDDDATLRLCQMLTERNIRATFKVVGEKARVFERHGRKDVITALKRHDIGYHSDFHSVHPTPTEYLADCGWLDGVAEFVRHEASGAADVRRIFGVPTLACYGQPGSSWGPQAIGALKTIGVAPHDIPCYVDEGSHVGIDGKPFWYAGALNVYHMSPNYTRMDLHDPEAVEPANKKVSEMAARLQGEGGGLISIFYHPCEWIHKEFWDGVNFAQGANPPREDWKPPGQRTPQETDGAFQRFGQYIDHIRTIKGVHWITASELPVIYPDRTRTESPQKETVTELAKRTAYGAATGLDYQKIGDRYYSVADQFELLTEETAATMSTSTRLNGLSGLEGPDAIPPSNTALTSIPWPAFRDAVLDLRKFIRTHHRVPSRVFIGSTPVPPSDFLAAMAAEWSASKTEAHQVALPHGVKILPERHVAADTPKLFGEWVIHKKGFQAPKLMEIARLQAWTLKPAIRAD